MFFFRLLFSFSITPKYRSLCHVICRLPVTRNRHDFASSFLFFVKTNIKMLLKPILLVTHYIIYLRSLIWSWLLAYSRQLMLPFHKNTLQRIASDAKTLDKLPIHLGIVIVEDDISYTDIANIILWCMAMGISYVSVYDRNGKYT